jgi:hypothetical protein
LNSVQDIPWSLLALIAVYHLAPLLASWSLTYYVVGVVLAELLAILILVWFISPRRGSISFNVMLMGGYMGFLGVMRTFFNTLSISPTE